MTLSSWGHYNNIMLPKVYYLTYLQLILNYLNINIQHILEVMNVHS